VGHELVIQGIIEQYVGEVEPEVKKGLVNVFSVIPFQNPFWRGDLEEIKYLLERIGLEVNILFGYQSKGVEEWKNIPNAEANIVISPYYGIKTAEFLKRYYGTPYINYPVLPVGAKENSKFLRTVADSLNLDKDVVEKVIAEEEEKYYAYFTSLTDWFSAFQNNLPYELYVTGDSNYTLGYTIFLENEVGYIPKKVYVTDDPSAEQMKQYRQVFEERLPEYADILAFDEDSTKSSEVIEEELKHTGRALVLGSDWERKFTKDSGNLFLYATSPMSQKVVLQKTYVGYRGGLGLVEDIYNTLYDGKEISGNIYAEKLSK
jgi:nitrogenase molybdenum-iron protein beta chain